MAPSRHQAGPLPAGPVLLAVPGPSAQRRTTVAVRLLLAVPHLLALCVLGAGALAVAVAGWFAALATGRLPRFAASYLAGYLRWYARVGAYLLLLTDAYPPFALADVAYPVQLSVSPGRLNRLSVLFRLVLAIPAAVAATLLTAGFGVIAVIAWLVALVAGRLPAALHQALAAGLRYLTRHLGYACLLTGSYPAGLFGDRPGPSPALAPPPAGAPAPGWAYGPSAGPAYGPGYPAPGYPAPGSGSAWLPGLPGPAGDPGGSAGRWSLALAPGARRLVGLVLVLGLLTAAGAGAAAGATIAAARQRDRDIAQLTADVTRYNAAATRHNAAVAVETTAAEQASQATQALAAANSALGDTLDAGTKAFNVCATVSCFDAASQADADAFAAFGRTLKATLVPPGSAAIAKRLARATADSQSYWSGSAQEDSFDDIVAYDDAHAKLGNDFDDDNSALSTSLTAAAGTLDDQAAALSTAAGTLDRQAAALKHRAALLNVPVRVVAAQTGV